MVTPTLNVNLKPCDCGGASPEGRHAPDCPGVPVFIPCPLPRTVEMMVRMGECTAECRTAPGIKAIGWHADHCPAHPIRVTCTIGGDGTWEGSEPIEAASDATQWQPSWTPAREALLPACCDRWAAVQALVLGRNEHQIHGIIPLDWMPAIRTMMVQRGAVFAALNQMVKAETIAIAAQTECDAAFPIDTYVGVPALDHRSEPRPSTVRLAAFVAHLITTVGDLP